MRTGIVVPNLNQGRFLATALDSLMAVREVPVSVAVVDGGSTDGSAEIIERYGGRLTYSRSRPDGGQAVSVNEGVAALVAADPGIEFVGFLNADDAFLDGGLPALANALANHPAWAAVAGQARIISESGAATGLYPSAPFSRERFARACTICQPATLVRGDAWQRVGGLDPSLAMCFDYDLWWRLAACGTIGSLDVLVAASRDHAATKTRTRRETYFREAMKIVRRECGRVPWHWYISRELEREAGWDMDVHPRVGGRLRAGARAMRAYVAANRRVRSLP